MIVGADMSLKTWVGSHLPLRSRSMEGRAAVQDLRLQLRAQLDERLEHLHLPEAVAIIRQV